MRPVVTVAEMRAADARALLAVEERVLVRRAGTAVAQRAARLLGSPYGRRVVVVAGQGNNGADGRVAAGWLGRRGARVQVVEAAAAPADLPPCDLVIDAAYGTGFRGTYDAPRPAAGTPVLAVDIPSGVDGDTGAAPGRPMEARETVTFAAWKLGLLQGDGPGYAGRVEVADIGVEAAEAGVALLEDADAAGLPRRPAVTHKWATAVLVVAGSPGMEGAAVFSAAGASHAGAGMVRLGVPGTAGPHPPTGPWPLEAVRLALPPGGWAAEALEAATRCRALVIGPGLGRSEETAEQVRRVVSESPVPVVADADALFALGDAEAVHKLLAASSGQPVVCTPHDGEYARLAGGPPGPDRVAAARALAERSGAVVLLKGSLTAVAAPGGDEPSVLLSAAGSSRLATAGSGDVLSGVIGAFVARGLPLPRAAALAAHVHGRAAGLGPAEGLVAGDLPALVSRWLSGALDGHG